MIYQLAEKLRTLRLQSKLSQKEVATRLGISPSIVSAYEVAERTPSVEILLALASLYKCSSDYLLGLERTAPQRTLDRTLTHNCLDVSGLSKEQISALQELIRTMQNK